MDFILSPTNIIILCCIVLPVVGGMIFTIFFPISPEMLFDWLQFNKLEKKMEAEAEAEQKFIVELAERGTVAEAKILSLRSSGQLRRLSGKQPEALFDYDVEVLPKDKTAFTASFQHWLPVYDSTGKFGADSIGDALRGERDQKIYVMFDPNDQSQIMHSHYEKDHSTILRMIEFNKNIKGNDELKRVGEQAEAVITLAEDLNLPYPVKKSRAMRLEFKVTPKSGMDFKAEGLHLIGDKALKKYSAGKRVFVRFDPQNPNWAVLDSERNKSL